MTSPSDRPGRRIGIFLFHDADGIVDDYIVYLLREMMQNLSRLIVMVNGSVDEAGRRKLEAFTTEVHTRPNTGFDIGAWKEALDKHAGFASLIDYDELVLFNDSFFGPLYPFREVFGEMARRGDDFWGLSAHGEARGTGLCPYGNRPRYLQTYFLVFGKQLLASDAFRAFWQGQPVYRHFEELADRFAAVLTRHFANLGFTWSAFTDTTDLEGPPEKNLDPHTFNLFELVSRRRYPVVKRRSFSISRETYLQAGDASDVSRTLDYIRQHYSYDLSLLFAHLVRRADPGYLKDCLGLNLILAVGESESVPPVEADMRTAVVAHLFYPELFTYSLSYLANIPPGCHLFITTDSEEKKACLSRLLLSNPTRKADITVVPPKGRDWAALLLGCRSALLNYDLLCFVHDKKSTQKEFPSVGAAFRDMLWENTLGGTAYIRRVMTAFDDNPHLGLLVPPPPAHGTYFKSGIDYWTVCYEATQALAARLGLPRPIRRDCQPIAVGSVFWCRVDALRPLFAHNWTSNDFPAEPLAHDGTLNHALERILPYVAQSRGFLTGWVMTDRQAALLLTNTQYMFDAARRTLAGTPGVQLATFAAFRRSLGALRRALRVTGLQAVLPFADKGIAYATRHCPQCVRRGYTLFRLHCRRPENVP